MEYYQVVINIGESELFHLKNHSMQNYSFLNNQMGPNVQWELKNNNYLFVSKFSKNEEV